MPSRAQVSQAWRAAVRNRQQAGARIVVLRPPAAAAVMHVRHRLLPCCRLASAANGRQGRVGCLLPWRQAWMPPHGHMLRLGRRGLRAACTPPLRRLPRWKWPDSLCWHPLRLRLSWLRLLLLLVMLPSSWVLRRLVRRLAHQGLLLCHLRLLRRHLRLLRRYWLHSMRRLARLLQVWRQLGTFWLLWLVARPAQLPRLQWLQGALRRSSQTMPCAQLLQRQSLVGSHRRLHRLLWLHQRLLWLHLRQLH